MFGSSKGMEMMLKSILTSLGVDGAKVEAFLVAGTGFFSNAETRINRLEAKLDLIISRTDARDNETAIAYLPNETGDITPVTGTVQEILS